MLKKPTVCAAAADSVVLDTLASVRQDQATLLPHVGTGQS